MSGIYRPSWGPQQYIRRRRRALLTTTAAPDSSPLGTAEDTSEALGFVDHQSGTASSEATAEALGIGIGLSIGVAEDTAEALDLGVEVSIPLGVAEDTAEAGVTSIVSYIGTAEDTAEALAFPFGVEMPLGVAEDRASARALSATLPGGGGGTTTRTFRTWANHQDGTDYGPSRTPLPADLEHPSGGTIYAGGSGTTHEVDNFSEWDTAVQAAAPGDIIKITTTINQTLNYRGTKWGRYSSPGSEVGASGTAGNPIIITCDTGVWIDPNNKSNNEAALDVLNADHVWVVGVNIRDSQFGLRMQNVAGTLSDPVRSAHNTIDDTGHSCHIVQGASGGTPPAGAEFTSGYSEYVLVENNTVTNPGQTATQFGECFYYGIGSPGWNGHVRNLWMRYNHAEGATADCIDMKPGCYDFYVYDNVLYRAQAHFGAMIGGCYIGSGLASRPSWVPTDINGWFVGNRVYDLNLTLTGGTTAPWPAYCGMSGIRWHHNIFWAWAAAATEECIRIRCEKADADFGTGPVEFVHNTYWGNEGYANVGYGVPLVGPVTATITSINNIADTATGAEHNAAASDFDGTVPAIAAAGAADSGSGVGSAFALDDASGLQGVGTSVASITFLINQDIVRNPIVTTGGQPGAFQENTSPAAGYVPPPLPDDSFGGIGTDVAEWIKTPFAFARWGRKADGLMTDVVDVLTAAQEELLVNGSLKAMPVTTDTDFTDGTYNYYGWDISPTYVIRRYHRANDTWGQATGTNYATDWGTRGSLTYSAI